MRRRIKSREERLNLPRAAINDNLQNVGTFHRTDSGFWGWTSIDGRQGIAETARKAIAACEPVK